MHILISLDTPVTCPQSNHTFALKEGITEQVLSDLVAKSNASQQTELANFKEQILKDAEREQALSEQALREQLDAEKSLATKRFAA